MMVKKLYINDTEIVNNDYIQGMTNERSGSITLSAGIRFEVRYAQASAGYGLNVKYNVPSIPKQNIPFSILSTSSEASTRNAFESILVGNNSDNLKRTVAHFDGRVYISEEDGRYDDDNNTEQSLLDLFNHSDPIMQERFKNYLLWIDGKGVVSDDMVLSNPEDWTADYVFMDDYKLPSLDFVKNILKIKDIYIL